jgi:hypothetical protein
MEREPRKMFASSPVGGVRLERSALVRGCGRRRSMGIGNGQPRGPVFLFRQPGEWAEAD